MKYYRIILLSLFTLLQIKAYSQITINADNTLGCGTLTATFSQTNSLSSVTSIKWDFGDKTTSTDASPVHTYSKIGIYDVKVVLNGTDSITNTSFIAVYEKPIVTIINRDTSDNSALLVVLQAVVSNESTITNTPLTYSWDMDGYNEGSKYIASHTFDSIGSYTATVIVSDTKGCKDTATRAIQLYEKLDVPNVFSPNNDSYNDLFIVSSNDKYYLDFQLFTRNGRLVYKTKAKTIEWDGKMPSGENLPTGIYYYIIKAEDATPAITQKGFLYLYR